MRIKQRMKKFLGVMLTAIMLLTVVTPVNAAGSETWYKTGANGNHVGEFYCRNTNLTPVKTIAESGNFYIYGTADKGDNLSGNVVTKIQIRDFSTGRVLTSTESYAVSTDGTKHAFHTNSIYLSAGTKIQIFFDACSVGTPPGGYRTSKINYAYVLQ